MGRSQGARNKATIAREQEMAQMAGGQAGEPDAAAVAQINDANRLSPDDVVVEEGALVSDGTQAVPDAQPAPAADGDFKSQLLQALKDPEIATTVVAQATTTAEGRRLLGLQPGQGMPSGEGVPDYDRKELRVMGGTEVRHGPDFVRLPPSQIFPWVREDGTKTVYAEPHYETKIQQVPVKGEGGAFAFGEDGHQIFEEKQVRVLRDPGAAKGPNGKPLKTEEYKLWLDATEHGGRYRGTATTLVDQRRAADGAPVMQINSDGSPAVIGEGVAMEVE